MSNVTVIHQHECPATLKIERIRAILWPADNPDIDWDSQTLDDVAAVLTDGS